MATLDLRVSSGTYVRSIADALGGHCRTLRRLEVGPFRVDEADEGRVIPPSTTRWRGSREIARTPAQLERQPRAVAIGTFDGVHLGHRSVVQAAIDDGPSRRRR